MTISQGLVMNKDEDPGFEIIHLSFRKKLSESMYGGPVNYYIGNIVFRLTDPDAKGRMEYYMRENEDLSVAPDLELLEKYYEGLHFIFDKEEKENDDGEKYTPLDIRNKNGIKYEDVFYGTLGEWRTLPVDFELVDGAEPHSQRHYPVPHFY